MIKKAIIFTTLLIQTCTGMEELPNLDIDAKTAGIAHWGFMERERDLATKISNFISDLFVTPPKPAVQLPDIAIQTICDHLDGNIRDIWFFLRTAKAYCDMAPCIIRIIRSNIKTLDLGFAVTYAPANLYSYVSDYVSDSTLRDKFFAVKLITPPEKFPMVSTLILKGLNIGDFFGWKEKKFLIQHYLLPQERLLIQQHQISFFENISKFTSLTSLDLSHNLLGNIPWFEHRVPSDNQRPSLIETLLKALPQLEHLNLSYNCLDADTLQSLGAIYPLKLKSLDFSNNKYNPGHIYHFLHYLISNSSLTSLKMKNVRYYNTNVSYYNTYAPLLSAALSPNNKLEYFDISENYLYGMHSITVTLCNLLRKNTQIKSLGLPQILFHYKEEGICPEFDTLLKARNGNTVLVLMNKFRNKNGGGYSYESPRMDKIRPRFTMLCERLQESNMATLTEKLMEAWKYHYSDEEIDRISLVLDSMNLSLTELYLEDLARDTELRNTPWFRDLKAIPGLLIGPG